jgi:hypothetical protein
MAISAQFIGALTGHVMFVPSGTAFTVPSSGTASASSKPGSGDTSWATGNLGDIMELKFAPENEVAQIKGGSPGGLMTKDLIEISRDMKITFKTQQMDPTFLRMAFATLALTTASTQANPLEGGAMVKGWLKVQAYDVDHVPRVIGDFWVGLRMTDMEQWSGRNIVGGTFEAQVLYSAYNTQSFATS